MVLVACAILPHGAQAFDNPLSESEECRERASQLPGKLREAFTKIHAGSLSAASRLMNQNPDLVILHTPHGISAPDGVSVYTNDCAQGSAEWKGCWTHLKVTATLDASASKSLIDSLQKQDIKVTDLNGGLQMPLNSSEVIPLWYLQQQTPADIPIVVISQRWPHSLDTPSLESRQQALGQALDQWIQGQEKKVAVVVSADLGHTYQHDCPTELYRPDPRTPLDKLVNQDAAVAYEAAIKEWVGRPDDSVIWDAETAQSPLEKCFSLRDTALPCATEGVAVLHELLKNEQERSTVEAVLHCCEAPTYFGMMAASFVTRRK